MVNRKGVTPGTATKAAASPGSDAAKIADLQAQLERLTGLVQQLTQVSSIECILANGFDELTAKLAPLQDLAPKRTPLNEANDEGDAGIRLESIIDSLKRPSWSDATSLPVPNKPVFPIGAKAPPSYEGSMAS